MVGIDSHSLNSVQVYYYILYRIYYSILIMMQGKKWLVLGLVWQLIKMYLFKQVGIFDTE